jgi:hypothetical protein
MDNVTEVSLGWTLAEAIERTSDPDMVASANGTAGALGWRRTAMWKRLSEGDLLATGCFDTPSGPPVAIDPQDFPALTWAGPISSGLRGIGASDVQIFNVRVFPVLHAPNAPAKLNGQSLSEVFRRYIIRDPEIASLAKRVLKESDRHSAVFQEGQIPGWFVDFHWPLETTASELEFRFVDSPVVMAGYRLPAPSTAISKVSKVLADRLRGLRNLLVSGRVVAFGTFVQTGVEGPIGRLQWTRSGISIEVESGDLCQGEDYRAVPKWTGVDLRLPEASNPANLASKGPTQKIGEAAPEVKTQNQTKEKSRLECLAWLQGLMSNPDIAPRSKENLWNEVRLKWPGKITKRAFLATREHAISLTEAWAWKAAGRKPKSTHS